MKVIPLPPGWQARPCAGDEGVLTTYRSLIEQMAYWVGRRTTRLAHEDVVSDLREALLVFVRQRALRGAPLSGALVNRVLRRRAQNLLRYHAQRVRSPCVPDASYDQLVELGVPPADPADHVEAQNQAAEQDEAVEAVIYLLRQNLTPAAFAILHLAFVEEMTAVQMQSVVGVEARNLRKLVHSARGQARVLLAQLGIERMADLDNGVSRDDLIPRNSAHGPHSATASRCRRG